MLNFIYLVKRVVYSIRRLIYLFFVTVAITLLISCQNVVSTEVTIHTEDTTNYTGDFQEFNDLYQVVTKALVNDNKIVINSNLGVISIGEDKDNLVVFDEIEESLVPKPQNFISLEEAILSNDNQKLLFSIMKENGTETFFQNLNTSKVTSLNYNGEKEYSHLAAFSPDNNKIAYVYGDISQVALTLYDMNKDQYKDIYTTFNILALKWSKSGEFVDFFIERMPYEEDYEERPFSLLRYHIKENNVTMLYHVTYDDIFLWEEK